VSTSAASPSRENGRLGAYVLRNRRTLIHAAQRILATEGASASIKAFADGAGMSVGSIYQHFGNKEGLIEAALIDALAEWNRWISSVIADVDDDFERLVTPMRLLIRLSSTHPDIAALFANCSDVITKLFVNFEPAEPYEIIGALVAAGRIPDDDVHLRTRTVLFSIAMLALVRFRSGDLDDIEADRSIGFILGMLGISQTEATRLSTLPLPVDGLDPSNR